MSNTETFSFIIILERLIECHMNIVLPLKFVIYHFLSKQKKVCLKNIDDSTRYSRPELWNYFSAVEKENR